METFGQILRQESQRCIESLDFQEVRLLKNIKKCMNFQNCPHEWRIFETSAPEFKHGTKKFCEREEDEGGIYRKFKTDYDSTFFKGRC